MGFFDDDSADSQLTCTTSCSKCKLYQDCKSPNLSSQGSGSNGIMLLLPPPSEEEDNSGIAGTGELNNWLRNELNNLGIEYDECIKVNVIGCYSDKAIKNQHVECCSARLEAIVSSFKPKLVIACGGMAIQNTIRSVYSRDIGDIERWRGFTMPFYKWNCWLIHTYSPSDIIFQENFAKNKRFKEANSLEEKISAIERNGNFRIYKRIFREDITKGYSHLAKTLPDFIDSMLTIKICSPKDSIEYIKETYRFLKDNPNEFLTLDLETSGLKPYNNNMFIYSCAISYKDYEACSFLVTEQNIPALKKLLSQNFKMCGANYKFDRNWLNVKLGVKPDNLFVDTVLASHLLDNRDGITSLKFNALTRLGIGDYEGDVSKYLKADGTNTVNRIREANEREVLLYCGKDVAYTREIAKQQMEEYSKLNRPNKELAWKLMHRGSIALAKMETKGIPIDLKKAQESMDICTKELDRIKSAIEKEPIWQEWKSIYKEKTSLISEAQIIDIFVKRKGLWAKGISRNTKPKADKEFLSKMVDQEPFIKYILEYRKYLKMSSTYLKSYFDETNDDGRIRCFYSLNNISSYRSGASQPNMQNQATRDSEQVEMLKSCFIVPEGYAFVSGDYSGLENYISANITGDKYMEGCLTGGLDMHSDNAERATLLTVEAYKLIKENHPKEAKKIRNIIGKSLSFSVLYGAHYQLVTTVLWKGMDEHNIMFDETKSIKQYVMERLNMEEKWLSYSKNNRDVQKEDYFESLYGQHIEGVIKDFWEVRMQTTNKWRNDMYERFITEGQIVYPTGHAVIGAISRNSVLNSPIQGSGSNILLYACCRMIDECEKRNYKGHPVMEIHDDIDSLVPLNELDDYIKMQKHIMEVETLKVFPWLKIPLKVEFEVSYTNWAEKKPYEITK